MFDEGTVVVPQMRSEVKRKLLVSQTKIVFKVQVVTLARCFAGLGLPSRHGRSAVSAEGGKKQMVAHCSVSRLS